MSITYFSTILCISLVTMLIICLFICIDTLCNLSFGFYIPFIFHSWSFVYFCYFLTCSCCYCFRIRTQQIPFPGLEVQITHLVVVVGLAQIVMLGVVAQINSVAVVCVWWVLFVTTVYYLSALEKKKSVILLLFFFIF